MLASWLPFDAIYSALGIDGNLSVPPVGASWTMSVFFFLAVVYPPLACLLSCLARPPAARAEDASMSALPAAPVSSAGTVSRLRALGMFSALFYAALGSTSELLPTDTGFNLWVRPYDVAIYTVPAFFAGMCAGRERAASAPAARPPIVATTACACGPSDTALALMLAVLTAQLAIGSVMLASGNLALQPVRQALLYWTAPACYVAVLALTRPGAPLGIFDAYVLRSRPVLVLGEISLSFWLLHTVGLHYGGMLGEAIMGEAQFEADVVASGVFKVGGWLLMLPAAWLMTHYFEKPVGDLITRHCSCG